VLRIVAISASQVPFRAANSVQAMKAVHALAQIGHQVTLVVPRRPALAEGQSPPSWNELAAFYGLTVPFEIRWLETRARRAFAWHAVRLARRLRPDLLYLWPLPAAALGAWLRLPLILEMHDLPSGRFGPLWFRLFLLAQARRRLAVITAALEAALRQRYGRLPETVIAPNGVDYERFAAIPEPPLARRMLGLPERFTVLCAGSLYAGRGTDLFLRLAERFPEAQFLWVGGSGEEAACWQREVNRRTLTNVSFHGFVPHLQLPLYHAAAEVLLMPYGRHIGISSGGGHSAQVASPMKMFEYLAAGRAILASDLPVFREVLNETLAVLCPPEDLEAWAQALQSLQNDPRRRQALGQRARQAASHYSWPRRAARILEGFGREEMSEAGQAQQGSTC